MILEDIPLEEWPDHDLMDEVAMGNKEALAEMRRRYPEK